MQNNSLAFLKRKNVVSFMVYGHIHGQAPVLQLDSEGCAILLHESNCSVGTTAQKWHNCSDFVLLNQNEQTSEKQD